MSYATDSVHCNDFKEKPIEHLVKSIYMMQNIGELDDETNILKTRLMQLFKDIPATNGVKRYEKFSYSASGLCYYSLGKSSVYHELTILLDPWEITEVEEEIKKNTPKLYYDFKNMERHHPFFWLLIKLYLNRKVDIVTNYIGRHTVKEYIDMYENYQTIDDEAKELIDYYQLQKNLDHMADSVTQNLFGSPYAFFRDKKQYGFNQEYYDKYTFLNSIVHFPTEETLKNLIDFYKLLYNEGDRVRYGYPNTHVEDLLNYIVGTINVEDCIQTNISVPDLYKIENVKGYSYNTSYSVDFDKFYNSVYLPLKKISETEPFVAKMLKKMKFI